MRRMQCCLISGLLASGVSIGAECAQAQMPSRQVNGVVVGRGAPLGQVNVFDIETLDGAVTDSAGRFRIVVSDSARTKVRIAARRVGFRALDTTATVGESVVLMLSPITDLAAINVVAGQYTSSAARTATLTPLEVATTPGTNADINSAIKTLPGVQNADEGNGVFVHGGDATETKTFVDGAPLFSAYQFDAPTGSVAGTINPFLLDRITFSSGGFGSMWGNALSGIIDLRTQGRPAASFVNANVSAVGAAVSGGLALPHGVGLASTLSMTDLRALFAVNGNPRAFDPAPRGAVGSGTASWNYSRSGIVKLFALRQTNRLGVPVSDPAFDGTFSSKRTSDLAVASWRESRGRWRSSASASTTGLDRNETYGAYAQHNTLRSYQLHGETVFERSDRFALTVGADVERLSAFFDGRFPVREYDRAPGAPTAQSSFDRGAVRDAQFISAETRPASKVQLIVGARTDRSGFTSERSFDPRTSLAWALSSHVTVTAAWGVYHQVADPAFLDRLALSAQRSLAPLRSEMTIGGVQFGEASSLLRVEGWSKQYENLSALTRNYVTVTGLRGHAKGVDVFARQDGPLGSKWRVTYSGAQSRRVDPNTGIEAPASFDVQHSLTVVGERTWRAGWSVGAAWRYASGRPYTDVTSARLDATTLRYVPSYGAPNAERAPEFHRLDLSVSRAKPFGAGRFAVVFAGITNLLNTNNLFGYTWSRDYSQRLPVRSAYNRSVFVGMNLSLSNTP